MVIGVPTFAVLYAAIKALINTSLKKKELPTETEVYLKLDSIGEEGQIQDIQTVEEKTKDTKKSFKTSKLWIFIKNLFSKFKKKK